MNNNRFDILAIALLMAGTLLTTAATTIVPAAYADNEVEAEDGSISQLNDCDDNELATDAFLNCEMFDITNN